jgi:hypothetical protein
LPPRIIGLAWVRDLAGCPPATLFLDTTKSIVAGIWPDRVIANDDSLVRRRRSA